MVTVTKSNISTGIWKNFRDRLAADVVNIDVEGTTVNLKTISSTASDDIIFESSNYPILIVSPPRTPTGQWTIGKTQVDATIEVEVFSRRSIEADYLYDAIYNSILSNRLYFANLGIKDLDIDDTDPNFFKRESMKVHSRMIRFEFVFRHDRGSVF